MPCIRGMVWNGRDVGDVDVVTMSWSSYIHTHTHIHLHIHSHVHMHHMHMYVHAHLWLSNFFHLKFLSGLEEKKKKRTGGYQLTLVRQEKKKKKIMVPPGIARIQEGNTKADKAKSGLVWSVESTHTHSLARFQSLVIRAARHVCMWVRRLGLHGWTDGRMGREGGRKRGG